MSSWTPTKYKTTNRSAYNAALKNRGSLTVWFDPEMIWRPPSSGRRGRQQQFSDAAIQVCLSLKVLFGMPLRQTTGFLESLLLLVGLDWSVPDYSTLCRRQRTLNVNIPYRGSKGPLNLLIDSTGKPPAEPQARPQPLAQSDAARRIAAALSMDQAKIPVDQSAALMTDYVSVR